MKKVGLALFVAALGLAAPHPATAEDDGFRSGVFEPAREAPDFELDGSNGAKVKLSALRGKVVILQFGFTYCPRICPVTLANVAKAFEQLGPAASEVQHVFITVDPERDDPKRLKEFLDFFDPAFLGATGSPEALDAVRTAYGVLAKRAASEDKKLGYEVHHSSSIFLVDREGKLRVLVPFGKSPDAIAHDIRLLLKK